MIGELLYHLHRHFRVVLIAGGLGLVFGMAALGYGVARGMDAPSAHPAETGRA
ncbi:hypothetical protein [Brevundimonas sp.]|jgi:hypothetical protein|uniref:hypothetical protein n=1 Tax=Brevundimonas sp. TaxID=1871086 RepID=UPI001853B7A1|nr:hypothetical protein [Brevundimonas sp.]MBA4806763.1 hypothetical protein [Brevundimonas sp.]